MGSRLVCRAKRSLYAGGIRRAAAAPLPVISVGNIALGGSGKTPLVLDLLRFLLEEGFRPALVSRGYKGGWEKIGGVVSDGKSLLAGLEEAGDEPFMAALNTPRAGVYVGRDRLASCRRAAAAGFNVAVLDDGFQHLRLARDFDIVLQDASRGRILREGSSALRRADIVLHAGAPPRLRTVRGAATPLLFPCATSAKGLVPLGGGTPAVPSSAAGERFLAFSGIARPERFFDLLEALGLPPAARISFPDHYAYPDRALARIASEAGAAGCRRLITTEKDAAKLRGRLEAATSLPAFYLKIGLDLPTAFYDAVRARLGQARSAAR